MLSRQASVRELKVGQVCYASDFSSSENSAAQSFFGFGRGGIFDLFLPRVFLLFSKSLNCFPRYYRDCNIIGHVHIFMLSTLLQIIFVFHELNVGPGFNILF